MKIEVINEGERLDAFLADSYKEMSRNLISKLIKNGDVLVNGNTAKSSYKIKIGDIIEVNYVEEIDEIVSEKMDLDIIYEDDYIIVLNKANGVVVHPANGNNHGTLVNGLISYTSNLSDVNGKNRRGIVHRLDACTTGLLLIAKNNEVHNAIAKQLAERKVTRVYEALVWGVIPNDTGTIEAPIGRSTTDRKKMAVTEVNSKEAITHFRVLERYDKATLIEAKLETGRTHQIRVHMDYIGFPVVNDPVYGRRKKIDETGQCLHAKKLGFVHPITNQYMEFTSEIPKCFQDVLEQFKNE